MVAVCLKLLLSGNCKQDVNQKCHVAPPLQAFPWVLKNHVREHKHWEADLGVRLNGYQLACRYFMFAFWQPRTPIWEADLGLS